MDRLKALLAEIKAALTRGGSGAARREANQQVVRKAAQGMRMAQEKERRLHAHVIWAVISFLISFGGLFLLRGLAGPLAKVGALLVLPFLSLCDLVVLYMMGVASAKAQLNSWAAPFVENHHDFGA